MLWNQYCLIRLSVVYRGRAVPVVWEVIEHGSSSVTHAAYEALLDAVPPLLPAGIKVVFLADRGFADTELLAHLRRLGWHFRIRIKANFSVLRPGQPVLQSGRLRLGPWAGRCSCTTWRLRRSSSGRSRSPWPATPAPGSIGISSVMNPPACRPLWSMDGALILRRTSWTINPTASSWKARSCAMPTPSPGSVSSWRSPPSIWWRKARRSWPQHKRRWVDPHWLRGNSYLRIGWQWVKTALARGWELFATLHLSGTPDPEPCRASASSPTPAPPVTFTQTICYPPP